MVTCLVGKSGVHRTDAAAFPEAGTGQGRRPGVDDADGPPVPEDFLLQLQEDGGLTGEEGTTDTGLSVHWIFKYRRSLRHLSLAEGCYQSSHFKWYTKWG